MALANLQQTIKLSKLLRKAYQNLYSLCWCAVPAIVRIDDEVPLPFAPGRCPTAAALAYTAGEIERVSARPRTQCGRPYSEERERQVTKIAYTPLTTHGGVRTGSGAA
jgi:hypothetical protein